MPSEIRPTDAELSVLRVLWSRGPCTVREVYEVLCQERDLGYTTVLKALQVMLQKGLVERDESERSHVFSAAVQESETQTHLLEDLVEKAFGGSALRLLTHALNAKRPSRKELDEIQKLLDQQRGGK
jgi:predicted transcriptional regulator